MKVSREVMREAIPAEDGAFSYQRATQPFPKFGPVHERLEQWLLRRSAAAAGSFEADPGLDMLLREGYDGSRCSVWSYATRWRLETKAVPSDGGTAFVSLRFQPGEAFQLDFSHEDVQIAGSRCWWPVARRQV